MIVIKNCNLWTMEEINNELGSIAIDGKKIIEVSKEDLSKKYLNAKIIDAKNLFVMPGIVEPHSHIGMMEQVYGWAVEDANEITNPLTPELKGIESIKPHDESFKEALENGVTTVCTGPGSANIIGGTFCALKTKGKTVFDMVIKEELAMKMALGENPKRCYKDKGPSTRMANAAILRNALKEAKIYKETWDKYYQDIKEGKDVSKPTYNQKYDSLKRVFEGLKVKIHAHQADDIVTAIKISEEFNLDYTIEHATEGYLIPEFLKEHHVRCILGPTLGNKSKYELKAKSFNSAKVLFDNDIPFAFMTDHPVITLDTTLAQTGLFVKAGLDYLAALKANTINAAKIVGLDNIVGSIKEGKDADIVIYSKDPLSYDSHVLLVMLNGNIEVNKL